MFDSIPTQLFYVAPIALLLIGYVQLRIMTMRKRAAIRALEMTMAQFKDDKDYVAHAQRELEIARKKAFWKF